MTAGPEDLAASPKGSILAAPRAAHVASIAIFVLTVAFAHMVSPLNGTAPVAYDTASMVLYFDRIINGQILEVAVPTTPKPLLSLVYGPIWELTHDWRPVVWVAVGVLAAAAASATLLAWRLAGPAAALFAGVAMASSSMLMSEALRGLATPWAILGWMLAGLAITARPARFATAGLALAFASLARVETLAIVGAAAIVLVVISVGPRQVRRPVPRRAWLLMLGLLSLPVMLAHDWLLIRNPWYWAGVSGAFSAQHPQTSGPAGIWRVLKLLGSVFRPALVMILLAIPGTVILLRRWPAVGIGAVSLAAGVAAFMLLIGGLGYVVPSRYAAPIVVTVIMAAAVAIGTVLEGLLAKLGPSFPGPIAGNRRHTASMLLLGAVGVAVALLLSRPIAPRSQSLRTVASERRQLNGDASRTTSAIKTALADPALATASHPVVWVPSQVWPQLALELGLRLDQVRPLPSASRISIATGRPPAGSLVLYLRTDDPTGVAGELAVSEPTTVGQVHVVPLVSDPAGGRWLLRLDAAADR